MVRADSTGTGHPEGLRNRSSRRCGLRRRSTQRIPALVTGSDTFISRLVGVKGRRRRNTFPDAQHRSPSHEIWMPSLNLV